MTPTVPCNFFFLNSLLTYVDAVIEVWFLVLKSLSRSCCFFFIQPKFHKNDRRLLMFLHGFDGLFLKFPCKPQSQPV